MKFRNLTHALWRRMYDRGWTRSELDDTLRSRVAHAINAWQKWYDWGHPVMWLVGRNDSGSSGSPRGRDLWWIPTEYVEGIRASLVADFEQRHGCYVTRNYSDVRATAGDIDWRIYDLQDDGHTVKVALYPNRPEHQGRLAPLPWQQLEVGLFLWWYVWEHKAKAQWFGLRRRIYYRALTAAVNDRKPLSCQAVPDRRSGGYQHWTCQLRKWHRGDHRFRNYTWACPGHRVVHAPKEPAA